MLKIPAVVYKNKINQSLTKCHLWRKASLGFSLAESFSQFWLLLDYSRRQKTPAVCLTLLDLELTVLLEFQGCKQGWFWNERNKEDNWCFPLQSGYMAEFCWCWVLSWVPKDLPTCHIQRPVFISTWMPVFTSGGEINR